MNLTDYVIIAAVGLILALAVFYILRQKKKGKKCIGCPYGASCCSKSSCEGGCTCEEKDSENK